MAISSKKKVRKHIKVNSASVSVYAGKLQNRLCIEVRLSRQQEKRLLNMLKKRNPAG
jgi:hypothetical protein